MKDPKRVSRDHLYCGRWSLFRPPPVVDEVLCLVRIRTTVGWRSRLLRIPIVLIAVFLSTSQSAVSQTIASDERVEIIRVDRILASLKNSGVIDAINLSDDSTGVLPQHNVEILQAAENVRSSKSIDEAKTALIGFSNALQKTGFRSTVRFVTTRNNRTVNGARIRYRAIGRKRVHSIAELSTSRKPTMLPIGIYVIWAERDGARTSRTERFDIAEKSILIELAEN